MTTSKFRPAVDPQGVVNDLANRYEAAAEELRISNEAFLVLLERAAHAEAKVAELEEELRKVAELEEELRTVHAPDDFEDV